MTIFTSRNFKTQLTIDIAIFFGGAAIFAILLAYLGSSINARVMSIQQARQESALRRTAIQSLATLRVDSERAKPYFSVLENILPPKDALIRFPRDMEDLARRNNAEFGFAFGAELPPAVATPGSIDFTFTLGGAYARLVDFIRMAESGRYILDWGGLDVNLREGAYRGTINGRVFYR